MRALRADCHCRRRLAHVDGYVHARHRRVRDGGVRDGGVRDSGVGISRGREGRKMSAPRASDEKAYGHRPDGTQQQRPSDQAPQPHGGTSSSFGRTEQPAPPRRLVEYLPRARDNVLRSLLKRGIPLPVAEDVVQDAVYRALKARIDPPSYRWMDRWLHVVAHNRATSWLRSTAQRAAILAELHQSTVSDDDPELRVEQRALLRALTTEFFELRAADRNAILADANDVRPKGTKRERDRFSLQLHRARLRLEARLRGWLVAVALRFRLDDVLAGAQQFSPLVATLGLVGASAAIGVAGTAPAAAAAGAAGAAARPPIHTAVERPAPVGVTTTSGSAVPRPVGRQEAVKPPGPRAPTVAEPVVPHQRVELSATSQRAIDAETRATPPSAPLLCVTNLPVAGTNCVAHPRR